MIGPQSARSPASPNDPRRLLLSRIRASWCTAVLLCLGWTGCVLPEDECQVGNERCAGDVVQSCKAHRGGIDSNSNEPGVGYHGSSPNTWEQLVTCRSADLCKTAQRTKTDGSTVQDAFCVLDPAPAPACAGGSKDACEGTTSVACQSGFAVERQLCASCDGASCKGGYHDSCSVQSDCADGLECHINGVDSGFCGRPCECADEAACNSCFPADDVANVHYLVHWVCSTGWCEQREN